MLLNYKAKNSKNEIIEGIIEAPTEETAVELIEEKGYEVFSLEERKKESLLHIELDFLERVKTKDLVVFSRQLSVMVSANLPLVQSLRILVKQTTNPLFKKAISEIADDVEGGEKLSQSLSHYPKIFSNFFVAMVRSGETSGRLDEVLNYLAEEQEKDYDLISKIKGAMIYPIFIVSGLLVVGAVMMVFVIPKLTDVLKESGGELPLSTRLLIGTSDFMKNYWYILVVIILAIFFGLRFYLKTSGGKHNWDFLRLKLPVFGKLFKRIYMVRMSRSLATLMTGGVPLTQALEIVSDVVGNSVFQDILGKTIKEVRDGRPMTSVFGASKDMPIMFSQMISVGEQTGKLTVILDKLADFYSREVDNIVTNLVSLLEPIIMVVLGIAVGIMVAAIIMPMYNMASSF